MVVHREVEQMLATLAAVWVNHWLQYGGSLIVDKDCDAVQIGMRQGRWRREKHLPMPLWHDGWIVGRWRMLSDLVETTPGLREASRP